MAGDLKPAEKAQAQAPFAKTFACSGCGASIKITALGQTLIAVCSACGTAVDATDENFKVIAKYKVSETFEPVIPLGLRGKLHGTVWECIGFMRRSDTHSFFWTEYLLYNPTKGFRWLSENGGHWSWVKSIKSDVKAMEWGAATFLGKNYQLFHSGKAKIVYIAGEFYWRAQVGDISVVRDYINPPEILSYEKTPDEITWAVGEYIVGTDIATAFKLKEMPAVTGVAPNQPWDAKKSYQGIGSLWVKFVLILVALQFFQMVRNENLKVVEEGYVHDNVNFNLSTTRTDFVTPAFKLSDRVGNLEVRLHAPVDNDWFSTEIELVNDDSGGSQEFEVGVEYYHGYDGEYWSEGSQNASYLVKGVPGGNYHLNIKSMSSGPKQMGFNVKAIRGVTEWSDFFWGLFWITIIPVFVAWRKRSFEYSRWQDSDFSPYHGSDDDE